jgi:hypothetical protein
VPKDSAFSVPRAVPVNMHLPGKRVDAGTAARAVPASIPLQDAFEMRPQSFCDPAAIHCAICAIWAALR